MKFCNKLLLNKIYIIKKKKRDKLSISYITSVPLIAIGYNIKHVNSLFFHIYIYLLYKSVVFQSLIMRYRI